MSTRQSLKWWRQTSVVFHQPVDVDGIRLSALESANLSSGRALELTYIRRLSAESGARRVLNHVRRCLEVLPGAMVRTLMLLDGLPEDGHIRIWGWGRPVGRVAAFNRLRDWMDSCKRSSARSCLHIKVDYEVRKIAATPRTDPGTVDVYTSVRVKHNLELVRPIAATTSAQCMPSFRYWPYS
jgi:hypothetical protein